MISIPLVTRLTCMQWSNSTPDVRITEKSIQSFIFPEDILTLVFKLPVSNIIEDATCLTLTWEQILDPVWWLYYMLKILKEGFLGLKVNRRKNEISDPKSLYFPN